MELLELTPGLSRWTAPHPDWTPRADWDRDVGCVSAVTPHALVLVDPLVPDGGWPVLDELVERAGLPVATLVTLSWHARSAGAVRERYPQHDGLPAGVEAWSVGLPSFAETLFWLPAYAALVAGDLLLGDDEGGVRVAPASWFDDSDEERSWYRERMPGEVRALLELPIERLLVSHGEPVLGGGREALADAVPGP